MENLKTEKPKIRRIKRIIEENYRVKTFIFKDEEISAKAKPGQYLMIWIPGIDEIPISISNIKGNEVWITVARVGEATEELHKMKTNDFIGVRGPYGKSFSINHSKVLMIGGGYGVAPLAWLAERIKERNGMVYFVVGAKKREDIILYDRIYSVSEKIIVTTEDGSMGLRGLATDGLLHVLGVMNYTPEIIYACGPEKMMNNVAKIAKKYNINMEASYERYIKCGIGICGSCAIDSLRLCIEGPILSLEEIERIRDINEGFKLDPAGRKISI